MDVVGTLDKWVKAHGNGNYHPDNVQDLPKYVTEESYGIQQNKKEISKLTKVLQNHFKNKKKLKVLEVGLGHYGSTHFLWTLLFEKVCTIEKNIDRVSEFALNYHNFYNRKKSIKNRKSYFMYGYSFNPKIVSQVYDLYNDGIDFLFIDGDHKYESVLADWIMYSNLVKKNGIVAFHDCNLKDSMYGQNGVYKLLKDLKKIDPKTSKKLKKISFTDILGIAYYIK